MAITDWTRTDLDYPMPHGGTALRFDIVEFCAYDVLVLKRHGAEADHPADRIAAARQRLAAMSESELARLERNLIDWVPAREFIFDRESFRRVLDRLSRDVRRGPARESVRLPARDRAGGGRGGRAAWRSIPTIRPFRSSACRASFQPPHDARACWPACRRPPMA